MVEIVNAISAGVGRPIQFFHLPVPKPRSDDAYYAPLGGLKLRLETELYLGLVHSDDMAGNATLAAAQRHVRVDGVATECGMGDPKALSGAARCGRADGRTGGIIYRRSASVAVDNFPCGRAPITNSIAPRF